MAVKLLSKKLSTICTQTRAPEYVCDYLCDYESDVATLPECDAGSTALCIDTGSVYMVNTSGLWTKLGG